MKTFVITVCLLIVTSVSAIAMTLDELKAWSRRAWNTPEYRLGYVMGYQQALLRILDEQKPGNPVSMCLKNTSFGTVSARADQEMASGAALDDPEMALLSAINALCVKR